MKTVASQKCCITKLTADTDKDNYFRTLRHLKISEIVMRLVFNGVQESI